jgi:hypothetical protein
MVMREALTVGVLGAEHDGADAEVVADALPVAEPYVFEAVTENV